MARALPFTLSWYSIILTLPVILLIYFSPILHDLKLPDDLYSYFREEGEHICEQPQYTARIASYSPLIIHLENFITPTERTHLISLGLPNLQPSYVFNNKNKEKRISPKRSSTSAFLRDSSPIINCVLSRAAAFQGHIPLSRLETLQVVRYAPGEQFSLHTDWGMKNPEGFDRTTTFFGYLKVGCERCGTWFPEVEMWGEEGKDRGEWCRFVECESERNGTVFRAVEGSAVFWRNLDDEEVGDGRALHAGLPPERGEKVGLNIWTRGG